MGSAGVLCLIETIGGIIRGVEFGGIGCTVLAVCGTADVNWGSIGGTDVVLDGADGVIGAIGGVICSFGGVVKSLGSGVWDVWGFIGGSDSFGGPGDVLVGPGVELGGLGLSWCLSRRMKVSHVTASGPPSCVVVIRQLCRKLTGSPGRWYRTPVNKLWYTVRCSVGSASTSHMSACLSVALSVCLSLLPWQPAVHHVSMLKPAPVYSDMICCSMMCVCVCV